MPHTYRAVIKGNSAQAVHAAQKRYFTVLGVVQSGDTKNPTILMVEHRDSGAVVRWLSEGPSQPPFPDGALLFYNEGDNPQKAGKKVWLAKHGWNVDDDLEGLEGLGRERHKYRITVKGSAAQAVAAAQAEGLVLIQNVREDTRNGHAVLLVGTSDEKHDARMKRWFDRGPDYAPFPVGTLIFYWDEKTGMRSHELRGLDSKPHSIPVAEYDVGEAVVSVWPGGRYNKWRVELTQLRNGRATVVWSEAVEEHTKEDAARVALVRANGIGTVTGLAIDRLRDAVRAHRAGVPHKKSWKVDDDLEGLHEFHPWSVSTLVPALHGKPRYRYFDSFKDALAYAQERARKGKRLRDGGRAYFILGHSNDPNGVAAYRVFRAFLGAERPAGHAHFVERREFVIVHEANGVLPHDPTKTRWKMNKAYSIEILSAETEKARRNPLPRR